MCNNGGSHPRAYDAPIAAARKMFSSSDAARVVPWIKPAIGLHDNELGDEPEAIGTTRFGGRPDLPSDVNWPIGPDGPLAFLGQISLSEIAMLDIDRALPDDGMLSFFLDIYDPPWGTEEEDRNRIAVIFHKADLVLGRRPFPPDIKTENRVERVRAVTPYLRWELPTADPLAQESLGFGECPFFDTDSPPTLFTEHYWRLEDGFNKPHIPVGTHKLLGWANGIYAQSEDCRLMCELARTGFPEYESKAYEEALKNRPEWRCLLELSDDEDLYGDSWADGGDVAFMIRDEDLRRCNFDRCWCVLSTT